MRRQVLVRMAVVGVLSGLLPTGGHADLFDTARQAVRTDLGRADTSGVTLRGGASLSSGLSPSSTTLLRGQGQVSGPCGAFDFSTSLTQAFDELPALFEALIGDVLGSVPMLVLCYVSPTLCDLAKHWQALVNMAIQAKYAQCQQIQMAMAYGGLRLRGGQISAVSGRCGAGGALDHGGPPDLQRGRHRAPDARRGTGAPGEAHGGDAARGGGESRAADAGPVAAGRSHPQRQPGAAGHAAGAAAGGHAPAL